MSIREGVTIVYFESYATRLFNAGHHIDCINMKYYLEKNKVPATQYIQKHLGNLYDCVDDLVSLGNMIYAFQTDGNNLDIVNNVSIQLKQWESDSVIVWFGEWASKHCVEIYNQSPAADFIVYSDPEKTINLIAQTPKKNQLQIPNIIFDSGGQIEFNSSGVIGEDISSNLDIFNFNPKFIKSILPDIPYVSMKVADRQWIKPGGDTYRRTLAIDKLEIDLLQAQSVVNNQKKLNLIGLHMLNNIELENVLKKIREINMSENIIIELEIDQLNDLTFASLNNYKNVVLKIRANLTLNEDVIKSIAINLNEWRSKEDKRDLLMLFEVEFTSSNYSVIDAYEFLIKLNEIEPKFIEVESAPKLNYFKEPIDFNFIKNKRDLSDEQVPLINGIIASKTGLYPTGYTGGVKHLYLEEKAISENVLSSLKELTAINSAIITKVTRDDDVDEELFYYDGDNFIKKYNHLYEHTKKDAKKADYHLSNFYQLSSLQGGKINKNQIQINDFHHSPLVIEDVEYINSFEKPSSDELKIRRIAAESDLEKFLKDYTIYIKQGIFSEEVVLDYYLADSCRWGGYSACSVSQLPRLHLDSDNNFNACEGCGIIGTLGDNFDILKQSVALISEQEMINRGCKTCSVANSCSKCVFLPNFMSSNQYCEIRRSERRLHQFMQHVDLFRGLRKHSKILKDISVDQIKLTLPTCSHLLSSKLIHSEDHKHAEEYIILFFIEDKPMVYNALTQKIFSLSEPLAFLLEAAILGVSIDQVSSSFVERYSLEEGDIEEIINHALNNLVQAGCLKRTSLVT